MTRSRKQSLRPLALLFSIATVGCGAANPPQSGAPDTTHSAAAAKDDAAAVRRVVGMNDPTVDVAAVQAAVDAYRNVRLVGVFDFGETGSVILKNDVAISGQPGATIKGGQLAFSSPLPEGVQPGTPPEVPGPAISIQHLTFDGARQAAIDIAYARSVDVSYNRITNVQPVPFSVPGADQVKAVQNGIMLGTKSLLSSGWLQALTGRVLVSFNELDMTVPSEVAVGNMCSAIMMSRGWGVSATVSHNTVVGCSRDTIILIDNSKDEAGAGSIDVSNNRVDLPLDCVTFPTAFCPEGITVGYFLDAASAVVPETNVPLRVTGNVITGGGPIAIGMFANSEGALIRNNSVALTNTGRYGIFVSSPNGLLSNNKVTGAGRAAFIVYQVFPSVSPNGNTLRCNDASEFAPEVADLFLYAATGNNVIGLRGYDSIVDGAAVVKYGGQVLDLDPGTGNTYSDIGCGDEGRD